MKLRIKIKDTPLVQMAMRGGKLAPLPAELEYAGNRQKQRIIDRTTAGLDWQGRQFVPYSTKGPYYYYPAHFSRSAKSRQRAVKRLHRLIRGKTAEESRITRTGLGIRFESYAAFKRAFGRPNWVDLTGVRAPHMLQSIVVRSRGNTIVIGIYDPEKAEIASGHNMGTRYLPRRHFFDVSESDKRDIKKDIVEQITRRLEGEIRGRANR